MLSKCLLVKPLKVRHRIFPTLLEVPRYREYYCSSPIHTWLVFQPVLILYLLLLSQSGAEMTAQALMCNDPGPDVTVHA